MSLFRKKLAPIRIGAKLHLKSILWLKNSDVFRLQIYITCSIMLAPDKGSNCSVEILVILS